MNIIELLISEKIAKNEFHAAAMLNKLDCIHLPDDAARLERCRLYAQHKHALKQSQEFRGDKAIRAEATRRTLANEPVPEVAPLLSSAQE